MTSARMNPTPVEPPEAAPAILRCRGCGGANLGEHGYSGSRQLWRCLDCGSGRSAEIPGLRARYPVGHVEYVTEDSRHTTIGYSNGKRVLNRETRYACCFCDRQEWFRTFQKLAEREIDEWMQTLERKDLWRISPFRPFVDRLIYCPDHVADGQEFDQTLRVTFAADTESMLDAITHRIRRRDAIRDQHGDDQQPDHDQHATE